MADAVKPDRASLPLVSVVVPCYNVADCVEAGVTSALEQTHRRTEVICVDDGSSDGTVDVLRRLRTAHPDRLRIVEGAHRGAPAARNVGLREAGGAFVQFLDADDVLAPNKIEHQLDLAASEQADLVVGAFHRRGPDGTDEPRYVGPDDPWVALVWSKMGVTTANLWRRESVEDAGGWKEGQHSSQEYELMFRMLCRGARVAFDEADLTTKHVREGSISDAYDAPVRESYLSLCIEVLEHLKAEGALDAARERRILDSIFIKVRNLYPLDREAALRHHRRAVPLRYLPNLNAGNTLSFIVTYKLFGLDWAERLRSLRPF